jgi:hypothetical protein
VIPAASGPSRRGVLLGGVVAVGLAGCTPVAEQPPAPDPLAPLAEAAQADATAARALAATLTGDHAARATLIANNRAAHATALRAEIDRERPPVSSSAPPSSVSATPAPQATLASLLTAMTKAQRAAADLVPSLPRYRAGLVGSVAAGCAALAEAVKA